MLSMTGDFDVRKQGTLESSLDQASMSTERLDANRPAYT